MLMCAFVTFSGHYRWTQNATEKQEKKRTQATDCSARQANGRKNHATNKLLYEVHTNWCDYNRFAYHHHLEKTKYSGVEF